MKKVFLLMLVMTVAIGVLSAGTMTVTNPVSSETVAKGSSYRIMWRKSGDQHASVKIRLYNSTGTTKILEITNNTANSGSFNWRVPNSVTNGNYVVRVKTIDNITTDDSAVFSISNPNNQAGSINYSDAPNTKPGSINSGTRPSLQNVPVVDLYDLQIKDLFYRNGRMFVIIKSNHIAFNGKVDFTMKIPEGFEFKGRKNLIIGKGKEKEVFLFAVRADIITANGRWVKVFMDGEDKIPETNNNNNHIERFIKVLDIEFKSLPGESLTKRIDQFGKWEVKFNINVKQNIKKKLVRYLYVSYKINKIGEESGKWTSAKLDYANGVDFFSHQVVRLFNVPERGKSQEYRVNVKIDPDNKIPEINEKNNQRTFVFTLSHE